MNRKPLNSSAVQVRKGLWVIGAVLCTLILLTLILVPGKLDIVIAKLFYAPGQGWLFENAPAWQFLYKYGTVPGLVLTLGALFGFLGGFVLVRLRPYRKYFLLIVLTSIIGAGFLVNVVMKPYCGRPRPREIVEFKGIWEFCAPCGEGLPGQGVSFPCGHCTMGFLFVPLVFFWPRSRFVAVGGAGFGLAYGLALGLGRAAQGAHFTSDIVWSLGTILIVAGLLHYIVIPKLEAFWEQPIRLGSKRKILLGLGVFVLAALITVGFLTRRPFSRVYARDLKPPSGLENLIIASNVPFVKREIRYLAIDTLQLRIHTRAFGWFAAAEEAEITVRRQENNLIIEAVLSPRGYFAEITHTCYLLLPAGLKEKIKIDFVPTQKLAP